MALSVFFSLYIVINTRELASHSEVLHQGYRGFCTQNTDQRILTIEDKWRFGERSAIELLWFKHNWHRWPFAFHPVIIYIIWDHSLDCLQIRGISVIVEQKRGKKASHQLMWSSPAKTLLFVFPPSFDPLVLTSKWRSGPLEIPK